MKMYKDVSGSKARQVSEVTVEVADWNCDGDIYAVEGIWVEWISLGRREFISLGHLEEYFTEV